ncbi:serine O-acetyltransferase [Cellvibrio japonicus]|uniref:Serine acetyltransferase n=1 Tax=Cellvibrio japonicus (strain Ueda107) TaxID=498211 RepID=B3PJ11_CELJU|nr:serine O-acetyltransferase [Cellvibrio japonicus]ACE83442.1 serine acetyltransferase [Cellvibrio japonicus Ueda107]QEI11213.1 serine O-acetyltransferase [Cellvibrio japonicus]QEI14787.1 serine O-acetyltransferase [Cellvibrio japonicus]QEI18367.1 serine O-acetyltransferase [Cellvibrio japonicus]
MILDVSLNTSPDLDVWAEIRAEAQISSAEEPVLASFYHTTILNHGSFAAAISFHLANQLDSQAIPAMMIREVFEEAMQADPTIEIAMRADIRAHRERDPACSRYCLPFLFFKGYHALQSWRVAHWLWQQGRNSLALYFQNQISQTFDVDIHPGARIGCGIMIDHATGVVIGETAVIEDNVSMLHSVTLGGSGCAKTDRHPKIRQGVLIGVGAKILGNIDIGEGAKIGAGSVVLESVAPHTTVAGVPAKPVGRPKGDAPARDMDHLLGDDG